MREFKEKRKIRKLLYSQITIGFLFIALFLTTSATWSLYGKYRETKENTGNALQELSKLQEREMVIREDIERLNSPRGVEEEIREKFGFTKEGEGVIVIVDLLPQKGVEFARQDKSSGLASVWESVVHFFKRD